jgi:hypothetical protein
MIVKKFLVFAALMLVLPAFSVYAAVLEGTVTKVDKSKKQIMLDTKKGSETVEFNTDTKGVDTLKTGDKVKINYTGTGNNMKAESVEASSASSSDIGRSGMTPSRASKPGISDKPGSQNDVHEGTPSKEGTPR